MRVAYLKLARHETKAVSMARGNILELNIYVYLGV